MREAAPKRPPGRHESDSRRVWKRLTREDGDETGGFRAGVRLSWRSTGGVQGSATMPCDALTVDDVSVTTRWSKLAEGTTWTGNSNVKYRLGVMTTVRGWWPTDAPLRWGGVHSGGRAARGRGAVYNSAWFCCEPKTDLKHKVNLKGKKNYMSIFFVYK